ncbi:hypothetical protein AQUCO_02600054v1 [Aquilegia coerulea]|uniref:BSD domain-containing protein n=1 Tax=Aquilegia coerulea TaxID=218851 RepID=A0A2G5D751_AQUCA|nr:hypothetical protein AQUCO_02600054v1 [Aquilegia coerulea]
MDFFKSVFSDDPEPSSDPNLETKPQTEEDTYTEESLIDEIDSKDPNFTSNSSNSSVWSFGGLIKTFASKSESVISTYKKDFEEFSSELKKETAVIRQVASRAVKELPASLEVGASVAQESLESVGQAIDDLGSSVWRGTTEIITQGKDVLLSVDQESDSSDSYSSSGLNSRRYNRFDSQIRSIQIDLNTYCEEPEDLDEFEKWKSGFVLGDKDEEIDNLLNEDGVMDSVYKKLVPKTIDDETFWSRYFYKVYKLKLVEEARANLVKRAISGEDEELSWDVDDEEEEPNVVVLKGETSGNSRLEKEVNEGSVVGSSDVGVKIEEKNSDIETDKSGNVRSEDEVNEEVLSEGKSDNSELNNNSSVEKSEEKSVLDGKTDSCKDSDISIVSSQPSLPEEQDLSWDEIEDLSNIDEKKASDSPNRADLRKRLNVADDEEDLSWDIEDDD